ncbi:Error-prone repair protein ImuA [Chitinophaga lutea]|uniref:Error-prone repair protein ImuA n=1 Tax=Chitinophaga lutea TaxID=2488634 RepID=A0A3N4QE27_9BACT|nr:Error-prone repair protein ImuA [Chitinophaga lutea]RPE14220.1 Error-prone repair protein ImuA [Chitinophaga lutea]
MSSSKADIIAALQREILSLQGYRAEGDDVAVKVGLESIMRSFSGAVFPTGAIHEFLTEAPEQTAASGGFITGLLAALMQRGGACIWISTTGRLFPPALKAFGVEPDRFIFINLEREKDVLWAMEECLKCEGLAAVIADLADISFAQSRRLQLAVEQSRVTAFILRTSSRKLQPIASTARWKIAPLPSRLEDGMPGVGFPCWHVELLKVRNGYPGMWKVEWLADHFVVLPERPVAVPERPAAAAIAERQVLTVVAGRKREVG